MLALAAAAAFALAFLLKVVEETISPRLDLALLGLTLLALHVAVGTRFPVPGGRRRRK